MIFCFNFTKTHFLFYKAVEKLKIRNASSDFKRIGLPIGRLDSFRIRSILDFFSIDVKEK